MENIARALYTLPQRENIPLDLEAFKSNEIWKSHNLKNKGGFWLQICNIVAKKEECHGDTYKKYVRFCYDAFKRSFDEINLEFIKLLQFEKNKEDIEKKPNDSFNSVVNESSTNEISKPTINAKPWASIKYPEAEYWKQFETFFLGSLKIMKRDMKTLLPEKWLNDQIISAFTKILKHNKENYDPYIFDSFFLVFLMSKKVFEGSISWGVSDFADEYNIWIIPYNPGCHWALIVIIFPEKMIIYLDSLHLDLSNDVVNRLCWYIEKVMSRKKAEFDWSEWKVLMADDIPEQNDGTNCGVHMCIWMHKIVHGAGYTFQNEDMPFIKAWMLMMIENYRNKSMNWHREKLSPGPVKYDLSEGFGFRGLRKIQCSKEGISTFNICDNLIEWYGGKRIL